jgi:hypothetical protein
LLKKPLYTIRAISRDITKPALVELTKLGCEVFSADYNDPVSLDNAVQGAAIVFAVTDFKTTFSVETEVSEGKAVVAAVSKLSCLEHFIWSTLPDTKYVSAEKYQGIYHCQAKPIVWHYIKTEYPLLFARSTALLVQAYFDNWQNYPGIFGPIKVGLF